MTTKLSETYDRPPDFVSRVAVAKRVAQWELGDESWASVILEAYMNPKEAAENLDMEMNDA